LPNGKLTRSQTISTLHKQNFDLKLELYHRRERQTALEEQVKTLDEQHRVLRESHAELEQQQQKSNELHDDLAAELDRRDKALAEAVDVILTLEARVAELVRERAMVRFVEADYPRLSSSTDGPPSGHTTPQRVPSKPLSRVPSFLEDNDERTAHLRDVILSNKDSFLHLRRISESSAAHSERMRLSSPSVSILSESSFLSVYGRHGDTPPPRRPEQPVHPSRLTPSRQPASADLGPRQLQDLLSRTSPLRRLELLETSCELPLRKSRPPSHIQTGLSPTDHDTTKPSTLPPTPDTISSSTLPRHSDDPRSPNPASSFPPASRELPRRSGRPMFVPGHARTQSVGAPSTSRRHDSDSDSESADYWLRESTRPNRQAGCRSPSPELFGLSIGSTYVTEALLGTMGGDGLLASPAAGLERDPADQDERRSSIFRPATAIVDSRGQVVPLEERRPSIFRPATAVLDSEGQVVPPERRSSAQRRRDGKATTDKPGRTNSLAQRLVRARSTSVDSGVEQPQRGPTPTQHPPLSNQMAKARRLSGLLLRRSTATAAEATHNPEGSPPSRHASQQSVPVLESLRAPADGQCATPPPIMLSRPPTARASLDRGPDETRVALGPTPTSPGASTPQSGRRRWLGLGKMGGLRNRNS
jgi:hypothetical protein